MAQKQSILGRIAQLTRANLNSMIDRAEDPEKMLDQLVRDYTESIREAEEAVAQTIGNLRLAEADHAEDVRAAKEWGAKAIAASQKADAMRTADRADEADRFDQLAKVAIGKQIGFENEAKTAAPSIASQGETVEKLKTGLVQMRGRLEELYTKRDQLVARQKTADAQAKVQDAVKSINVMDPTSELSRFEERVRRQEALVAGQAELANDSLESQFDELEADSTQLEIDARLAELKGQLGTGTEPSSLESAPEEQPQSDQTPSS
ncbi:PspA/IM30 family protein [Aeromicrobium sp. CF4.19]|uniref:PspA/IM30 family protein n=1 Tax=Aeromicrobium sp. CF4.19 TaxID=3373082 RepID=UPI003EE469A8